MGRALPEWPTAGAARRRTGGRQPDIKQHVVSQATSHLSAPSRTQTSLQAPRCHDLPSHLLWSTPHHHHQQQQGECAARQVGATHASTPSPLPSPIHNPCSTTGSTSSTRAGCAEHARPTLLPLTCARGGPCASVGCVVCRMRLLRRHVGVRRILHVLPGDTNPEQLPVSGTAAQGCMIVGVGTRGRVVRAWRPCLRCIPCSTVLAATTWPGLVGGPGHLGQALRGRSGARCSPRARPQARALLHPPPPPGPPSVTSNPHLASDLSVQAPRILHPCLPLTHRRLRPSSCVQVGRGVV